MPDVDNPTEAKQFYTDVPMKSEPFFLRGSNSLDWGMQNRFSRLYNPKSGRIVMLAIDHGYFMGPTTGLERVDIRILPILPYCDALMLTRGMLRTTIPSTFTQGTVLRASGGPSILREMSNERIAMDIEDAVRLNTSALAVQDFVGAGYGVRWIDNLGRAREDVGQQIEQPALAFLVGQVVGRWPAQSTSSGHAALTPPRTDVRPAGAAVRARQSVLGRLPGPSAHRRVCRVQIASGLDLRRDADVPRRVRE